MTEEKYEKCMRWTKEHIGVARVRWLMALLTAVTAVLYGVAVVLLAVRRDARVLRFLLVPASGFAAVTVLRSAVSARRPYEVYSFTPLLDKDTRGNSFPSRHVFSNVIIAMAVLQMSPPAGVFLLVCGLCLAVLRVITGVHFPRDVVAGATLAVLLGMLMFL